MSYQEIKAAGQAPVIFALAILFVYLFLVAQYENWSIPLAVLLSVPLSVPVAVFGGLATVGAAVFGDMLAATVIGTLLIPVMYFFVQSIRE